MRDPYKRMLTAMSAALVMSAGLGIAAVTANAAGKVQLVRPDGTYPTKPLEKDVVVIKVVQNSIQTCRTLRRWKRALEKISIA